MLFKSLSFEKKGNDLAVSLLGSFSFDLPLDELARLDYKLTKNPHEIILSVSAEKKFMHLIEKYMPELKSNLTGNKTIYIHQNSGIPLHGLQFIGIVDKGTDMIEIKPLTSCLLNCSFCSVGEGTETKKQVEFVVEEEYLVNELDKLLQFKLKHDKNAKLSIWINPQGEPLMYSRIVDLARDVSELEGVKEVYIITSGVLLNKEKVDELAKIKNLKLSVSISAFSQKKASEMMGSAYSLQHVLGNIKYAMSKPISVTLTPVYMKGINDEDMVGLIEFSKANHLKISIQKFCSNKFGRNPIKEQSWDDFMAKLKEWGQEFGVELLFKADNGQAEHAIGKSAMLPMPFKKNDVVDAEILCPGRMLKDRIAVAKQRCILLPACRKESGRIKAKITSSKYGMYIGSC